MHYQNHLSLDIKLVGQSEGAMTSCRSKLRVVLPGRASELGVAFVGAICRHIGAKDEPILEPILPMIELIDRSD